MILLHIWDVKNFSDKKYEKILKTSKKQHSMVPLSVYKRGSLYLSASINFLNNANNLGL